jgi:uncharacterized membrane protein YphA (DoxX/SURF4 family)
MRHIEISTTRPVRNVWGNRAVWTLQALLSLLFLFAGGSKLAMPVEALEQQAHLPGLLLQFVGVCEVLGGLGLVLPGAFRIRTELTPLAAAGLTIIMACATVLSFQQGAGAMAAVPFAVGLTCAFIANYRNQPAPRRVHTSVLRTAG